MASKSGHVCSRASACAPAPTAQALAEVSVRNLWLHFLFSMHVHEALNATLGLRPTLEAGVDFTLLRLLIVEGESSKPQRLCRTNESVAHLLPPVRQPMLPQMADMCPRASRGVVMCKHRSPRCAMDARYPNVGALA
jgi:hypothetical protein